MKVTFDNLDEFNAFIDRVSVVCPSKFGLKDSMRDEDGVCQYEGKSSCINCWLSVIGEIECNVIVDGTELEEVSYPHD